MAETLPTLLTAVSALLTALTGAVVAFRAARSLGKSKTIPSRPVPGPKRVPNRSPDPGDQSGPEAAVLDVPHASRTDEDPQVRGNSSTPWTYSA